MLNWISFYVMVVVRKYNPLYEAITCVSYKKNIFLLGKYFFLGFIKDGKYKVTLRLKFILGVNIVMQNTQ